MLYIDRILETMPYGKTKPIKVKDIKTGEISNRMMYFQTCNVVGRPGYLLRNHLSRVTLKQQEIEGIIHEIIEEIPKEWETYSDRTYLEEILSARALSKKIFE